MLPTRVVEGVKLEHRFLFNGKIIKLLSLSLSRTHTGDLCTLFNISHNLLFFTLQLILSISNLYIYTASLLVHPGLSLKRNFT